MSRSNTSSPSPDSLRVLLDQYPDSLSAGAPPPALPTPQAAPSQVPTFDYQQTLDDAKQQAEEYVDGLAEFMFEPAWLGLAYVQQRLKVDKLALTTMLFRLKTQPDVVGMCQEDISSGDTSPRKYEVFARLDDNVADTQLKLQKLLFGLEESYKKLKHDLLLTNPSLAAKVQADLQSLPEATPGVQLSANGGLRGRGTLTVLRQLESDAQNVDYVEVEASTSVASARDKAARDKEEELAQSAEEGATPLDPELFGPATEPPVPPAGT